MDWSQTSQDIHLGFIHSAARCWFLFLVHSFRLLHDDLTYCGRLRNSYICWCAHQFVVWRNAERVRQCACMHTHQCNRSTRRACKQLSIPASTASQLSQLQPENVITKTPLFVPRVARLKHVIVCLFLFVHTGGDHKLWPGIIIKNFDFETKQFCRCENRIKIVRPLPNFNQVFFVIGQFGVKATKRNFDLFHPNSFWPASTMYRQLKF